MIAVFTIITGITIYFVYCNCSLIKTIFLALNLIFAKKHNFGKWSMQMGELKPINIKNRTYYFYDIIRLDEYDGSNITVDKKRL